jgi:outer membrane protein OmpA-like peptidoglycan-associated protein
MKKVQLFFVFLILLFIGYQFNATAVKHVILAHAGDSKTELETNFYKNNSHCVLFDFDSYVMTKKGKDVLDAEIATLKANPTKQVMLIGYIYSSAYTLSHEIQLSKDLVNSVKNYMINAGINPKQIKALGRSMGPNKSKYNKIMAKYFLGETDLQYL